MFLREKWEEEKRVCLTGNKLKHPFANSGLYCFDINCAQSLPTKLHRAWKEVTHWEKKKVWAWKFEWFIFDLLENADAVGALVYPLESCFAPLKSKEDLPYVQQALLAKGS